MRRPRCAAREPGCVRIPYGDDVLLVVAASEGDAADNYPDRNLTKVSDLHAKEILLIILHAKLN